MIDFNILNEVKEFLCLYNAFSRSDCRTLKSSIVEGLVTVFLVLLKWEVAAILGNGCGVQGQNYVAWLQGSKMSVGGW